MKTSSTALLIVISGPSGTGKTTLCNRLIAEFDFIRYSVSCTTRPPRPGEVDGESYHFMDEPTFSTGVAAKDFLEYATVHGYSYGTLNRTVNEALASGQDVLMDLDVQGTAQIRDAVKAAGDDDLMKDAFVDIFIAPPSMETLNQRLRDRGQDGSDVIERRLNNAGGEMEHGGEYRYLVVNDTLERSYDIVRAIVLAEHHRNRRKGSPVHVH